MSLVRLLGLMSLSVALLVGCGQIGEEPTDSGGSDDTGADSGGGDDEICDNDLDDDGDGDTDCDDSDCDGDAACTE
jgi:hypothetical protein